MKWSEEEIEKCIELLKLGHTFKEISKVINKSHDSVSKKMRRMGFKFWNYNSYADFASKSGKTKYELYDWNHIQKSYDCGDNYREIIEKFSLTPNAIIWAQNNGKLKMRNLSEASKLARKKGRGNISKKKGIEKYRQLCEFKFSVKSYPKEFDLKLIQKHGWYKAANRGNNLGGVSRDHIISVKFGFENGINPEIISHPANCRIIRHIDNQIKNSDSEMSVEELKVRIQIWDAKYRKSI